MPIRTNNPALAGKSDAVRALIGVFLAPPELRPKIADQIDGVRFNIQLENERPYDCMRVNIHLLKPTNR